MWSSFLVAPPCPSHLLLIPRPKKPAFSSASQPHRRRSQPPHNEAASAGQVGELGHTVLPALQSNPQRREREGEGSQIRGSDVLWALQRASASKKKKKKKKKQRREGDSSSASSRREESDVDYSSVRPLCIKSEWGDKFDDLEKRLRELSEIV